jgi:hypothetical protein
VTRLEILRINSGLSLFNGLLLLVHFIIKYDYYPRKRLT